MRLLWTTHLLKQVCFPTILARDVSKRNIGFIDLRRTEVERESKLLNSSINGNNPRTESKRIRREKSLDYKG